jgi:hypothetical protein
MKFRGIRVFNIVCCNLQQKGAEWILSSDNTFTFSNVAAVFACSCTYSGHIVCIESTHSVRDADCAYPCLCVRIQVYAIDGKTKTLLKHIVDGAENIGKPDCSLIIRPEGLKVK